MAYRFTEEQRKKRAEASDALHAIHMAKKEILEVLERYGVGLTISSGGLTRPDRKIYVDGALNYSLELFDGK